jgi:hypothetical protein
MKSKATMMIVVALLVIASSAQAEGLCPTPWGWRACPCCREFGFPGVRGRPPLAFTFGPLAFALWREGVQFGQPYYGPPPPVPYPVPPPEYGPPPNGSSGRRGEPPPDVLNGIEGNQRGISRAEVEAVLVDYCTRSPEAALCQKLRRR